MGHYTKSPFFIGLATGIQKRSKMLPMGRSSKFIRTAKRVVKGIQEGKVGAEFLDMFGPFSEGLCFWCRESLRIVNTIQSGSGTEYQFRCGHAIILTGMPEIKNGSRGSSYSRVGENEDGHHHILVNKRMTSMDQEEDEISLAKTISHNFFPRLSNFKKDIQSSPVDVIAESDERTITEFFQITKLSDEQLWTELNRNKQIDRVMPEISKSVEAAIKKKQKYESKERNKIILLIDSRPGIVKKIADEIAVGLSPLTNTAGFKEIWLAGSIRELTHRIY